MDEYGCIGLDFSNKSIGEEHVKVVGFAKNGKEMSMCELSGPVS